MSTIGTAHATDTHTTDAHAADAHGQVSLDEVRLAQELPGSGRTASPEVAEYATRLGDDALILAQRLGWWVARAPELEEDMALANIGLDLLGHARALLHYAGSATDKTEDDLAYFRDEPEFRSCWLVEQPNGHFGDTIARQFLFSAYQVELYAALESSADESLAAIAAKASREVRYHLDHAVQWVLRLGGGTELSRDRMIQSLVDVWPYVDELFADDELTASLAGAAPAPSSLRAGFDRTVTTVLAEAQIAVPTVPQAWCGGRRGVHSTELGHILTEMQWLARRHPGVSW